MNFEDRFNKAGYDMLNGKQTDGALFVFKLNTKLYPQSANAWDSYGEALWKAKQIDKAIESYNKAIALDPTGVTGDNARNMLKQIKAEKGN
jgi:tetratricopeptide (TPR) repeat protein